MDGHCRSGHQLCHQLVEARRFRCLCQRFLLFRCESDTAISEQTWRDVLTSKLEGIPYDGFCGYGNRLELGYVYVVAIEAENPADCDKILNLIDKQTIPIPVQRDGVVNRDTILFRYIKLCCVEEFLGMFDPWLKTKKKESDVIFADRQILSDIRMLQINSILHYSW